MPETVGIIAGNGSLPVEIADALITEGHQVVIAAMKGEAEREVERFDCVPIGWGEIGKLFKTFKEKGVHKILLAGGIVRRPEFGFRKMDWGTIRVLPTILMAIGGDNSVLTSAMKMVENEGFAVVGVADLLPGLLVSPGANTAQKPKTKELQQMKHAAEVIMTLGKHDIGQAAVVVGSRTVAIEGAEGTDQMLQRIADLRKLGRLPNRRSGVLTKCLKPGQDERADLPTIGPRTIENVHAANLRGIGVEAGKTIILEREKTLERARALKVFVYGLGPSEILSEPHA